MPPILSCPDLMERLISAQNHPRIVGKQDIMSCVGFFNDRDELERHVTHYEGLIASSAGAA